MDQAIFVFKILEKRLIFIENPLKMLEKVKKQLKNAKIDHFRVVLIDFKLIQAIITRYRSGGLKIGVNRCRMVLIIKT